MTARTIKEFIYIRVNNPALNRNKGKLNLHHIWHRVTSYVQNIGHAQSTQPNTPMHIFIGSMGHAQRTPLSEHVHRTS